jgi:ribosomal protein S12 methylthiotransferase accessory factor YcaO
MAHYPCWELNSVSIVGGAEKGRAKIRAIGEVFEISFCQSRVFLAVSRECDQCFGWCHEAVLLKAGKLEAYA